MLILAKPKRIWTVPHFCIFMKRKTTVSRDLMIKPTRTSFGVEFLFSEGILRFSGDSYPENSVDFFLPLLQWVSEFVTYPCKNVTVELRVKYFNTSTSKYLFQIMELLQTYHAKGNELNITWFSQGNDDDVLETWRELMHELDLSFDVINESHV